MTRYLLRQVSIGGRHQDILIEDGFVAAIGSGLDAPERTADVDCADQWLAPALLDLHTHLREPGFEHKEDIETGCRAAIAGGFGALCPMPNTDPAPDKPEVIEYLTRRAREVGRGVRILPVGAATVSNARKAPSDYEALLAAGCVMISDDPLHILDDGLFRECLSRCAEVGLPFGSHCEIPGAREEPDEPKAIERACLLAKETGAHLHVQHISTRDGARLLREAKGDGIQVTCEVCPHHLFLTREDITDLGTLGKVGPSLKGEADVEALRQAVLAGEADALATDHAPHASAEKAVPFSQAPPGMIGLECAAAIAHAALWESVADPVAWNTVRDLFGTKPWGVLGLEPPAFEVGAEARFALFAFGHATIEESWIHSRSANCPYIGRGVHMRPVLTVLGHRVWGRDGGGRLIPLLAEGDE